MTYCDHCGRELLAIRTHGTTCGPCHDELAELEGTTPLSAGGAHLWGTIFRGVVTRPGDVDDAIDRILGGDAA
ncbi:MAG: hypothetical protein WD232_08420 [Acidimicrobiales bacterium]